MFMRILKLCLKIICGIFIGYAVIFSIAATTGLCILAHTVYTPYRDVKRLKTSNPRQSLYMKEQKKKLQAEKKNDTLYQFFIPLDSISPHLIKAVLAAEDDGFYYHPGFDLSAMAKAVEINRARNGIHHGASTITQQVAKNFFAGGEKSFERKYKELAYALLMEWLLGKDRILELYMNYAQWGTNLFGCEAAARHYYRKSSAQLTVSQAAHLAAVLARPEKLTPYAGQSALLQKRLSVIANNMYRRRSIDSTLWIELGGDDASLLLRDTASAGDSLRGNEQSRKETHERSVRRKRF